MDFNWDRDLLDSEIAASASARGLATGAAVRTAARGLWGAAAARSDAEELWRRAAEVAPDTPFALARRRWAFAVLEHDRLAHARASLERAWQEDRHPVAEPDPGRYTVVELRAKALSDEPRRIWWIRAFAAASSDVATQFGRLWNERCELGDSAGADLRELDGATPTLFELAERWLDHTDGMYGELGLDETRWLDVALARGAAEGWPGHLNWRSVSDLLGGGLWLGGCRPSLPEPPSALGASSYCRAFRVWGTAWAESQLERARPFMAWRDPTQLAERTRGCLVALLPLNGEFMRRRQGISRLRVRDQRRNLARSLLLESRWMALRTVLRKHLRSGATAGGRSLLPEYEELWGRALGFAPPVGAPGALPRLRALDAQNFAGLLVAANRSSEFVEQYDEDWFWNPRCCEVLRETFPNENSALAPLGLESGSDALLCLLADALG